MTRILCATDLLAKSEAAITRAGLQSAELEATVSLLHVVAPTHSECVLEEALQNAIGLMKSRARPPLWCHDPRPSVMVRTGIPARHIVDTIEQVRVDILVVGPPRKRVPRDELGGTIAAKVLSTRRCPVLIVQNEPRGAYQNVLLAMDLSPNSGAALRAAESLVLTAGAQAWIVHAYEPPYQGMLPYADFGVDSSAAYRQGWKCQAAAAVRDLVKNQSADCARYEIVIAEDQPARSILRAIEQREPDLLVMGTQSRGRMWRAVLGSVANNVLQRARCDVLVVPVGSFNKANERERSAKKASASRVSAVVIPGRKRRKPSTSRNVSAGS